MSLNIAAPTWSSKQRTAMTPQDLPGGVCSLVLWCHWQEKKLCTRWKDTLYSPNSNCLQEQWILKCGTHNNSSGHFLEGIRFTGESWNINSRGKNESVLAGSQVFLLAVQQIVTWAWWKYPEPWKKLHFPPCILCLTKDSKCSTVVSCKVCAIWITYFLLTSNSNWKMAARDGIMYKFRTWPK